MKGTIRIFALMLLVIIGSSCIKQKMEETYSKQEESIDRYLNSHNTARRDSTITETDPETGEQTSRDTSWTDTLRIVYNKGAARLVQKEGSGEELEGTGAVSFYYAAYVFRNGWSSSSLFATNHQETASMNFILSDADYNLFEADMTKTELLTGLRNGLIGVRAGEECEIVFSAKYGFGKEAFGTVPANSSLLYKIWVIGVSND